MGTMLDSAVPPSAAQIALAKQLYPDLVGWLGYVPTWGRPYIAPGSQGWVAEAVKVVLDAGLGFFPLLVPFNGDFNSTPSDITGWQVGVAEARKLIQDAGGQFEGCGVNIEAPWVVTSSQQLGWRDRVVLLHEAMGEGEKDAVYGPPSWLATLASLGGSAPWSIIAGEWPNGTLAPSPVPSSPVVIPGIPDGEWADPGQRAWQYQGGHELDQSGLSVDTSVVDDAFPLSKLVPVAPPAPVITPLDVLKEKLALLQSDLQAAIDQANLL